MPAFMYICMDGQINGWMYMIVGMSEQIGGWMDGWISEWLNETDGYDKWS